MRGEINFAEFIFAKDQFFCFAEFNFADEPFWRVSRNFISPIAPKSTKLNSAKISSLKVTRLLVAAVLICFFLTLLRFYPISDLYVRAITSLKRCQQKYVAFFSDDLFLADLYSFEFIKLFLYIKRISRREFR